MVNETKKKFIVWDARDGLPKVDADTGKITSGGVLGRIDEDNVYLTTYPEWPEGAKKLVELDAGEAVTGVIYTLSGSAGLYDVYRVR